MDISSTTWPDPESFKLSAAHKMPASAFCSQLEQSRLSGWGKLLGMPAVQSIQQSPWPCDSLLPDCLSACSSPTARGASQYSKDPGGCRSVAGCLAVSAFWTAWVEEAKVLWPPSPSQYERTLSAFSLSGTWGTSECEAGCCWRQIQYSLLSTD